MSGMEIELIPAGPGGGSVGVCSIPVPDEPGYSVEIKGRRSQAVPVGVWPRSESSPGRVRRTRRALVFWEESGDTPIARIGPCAPPSNDGVSPWNVRIHALEDISRPSNERTFCYNHQPCELILGYGGGEARLSLAIENDEGLHRWQYVNTERLWGGPLVEAWRIGGHIYTGRDEPLPMERIRDVSGILAYPDNTIAASVYLLLFANGVAQITGHWINGRIYGAVGDQKGIPVVTCRPLDAGSRAWNGADARLQSGAMSLNLQPADHLVSPERPAKIRTEGSACIWQIAGDTRIVTQHPAHDDHIVDIQIDHSSEGLVKGCARSATWTLSLSDAEPCLNRYLAPPDWYSANCEFAPIPFALRDGPYDHLSRLAAEVLLRNSASGSFISGGIYRYLDEYGKGQYELSMDANETRSLFVRAWRDSDERLYDLALRNAYFMADIAVDHSRDIIHYHNDGPDWHTFSLIYQRFSGIVFGFLETGDPYLLETAKAIARNYMALHLQNWPRQGIGRDADPLTGFLLLWDYTGDEEFFGFARTFAGHVVSTIADDGSWRSGAGVGPMMGCNASDGTAWNGGHLLNGFTEYAMRDPDCPDEWLERAGRALRHLYDLLDHSGGFHPASSGFLGRLHWYLACRLQDPALIQRTHDLLAKVRARAEETDGPPIFTGPSAHHQNNFVDGLLFYECTRNVLPEALAQKSSAKR